MDAPKLLLALCRETSFTILHVSSNRSQWWTTTGENGVPRVAIGELVYKCPTFKVREQ